MSQSLPIHAEQRKLFVLQQVSALETLFQKWINSNNLNEEQNLSSQIEEQVTQSQTATHISHFQGFLTYLRSLNNNELECHTIKSLQQHFDYMQQVLENEVKLYSQRQILKDQNQQDNKKGHKFSKSLILFSKVGYISIFHTLIQRKNKQSNWLRSAILHANRFKFGLQMQEGGLPIKLMKKRNLRILLNTNTYQQTKYKKIKRMNFIDQTSIYIL